MKTSSSFSVHTNCYDKLVLLYLLSSGEILSSSNLSGIGNLRIEPVFFVPVHRIHSHLLTLSWGNNIN